MRERGYAFVRDAGVPIEARHMQQGDAMSSRNDIDSIIGRHTREIAELLGADYESDARFALIRNGLERGRSMQNILADFAPESEDDDGSSRKFASGDGWAW
jgi:hypothetical protein